MNPRVGLPSNLVLGQTSDLLLVQVEGVYPTGKITFGFNQESRSITGIQKAAQFFLKILFTTVGTDLLNPLLGTNFQDLVIRSNITQSPSEFLTNATSEILSATTQASATSETDPASTVATVQILGINTSNDSISLYLQLVTQAGDYASIAVPFPQLNLNV
jgi:hypothetical protein